MGLFGNNESTARNPYDFNNPAQLRQFLGALQSAEIDPQTREPRDPALRAAVIAAKTSPALGYLNGNTASEHYVQRLLDDRPMMQRLISPTSSTMNNPEVKTYFEQLQRAFVARRTNPNAPVPEMPPALIEALSGVLDIPVRKVNGRAVMSDELERAITQDKLKPGRMTASVNEDLIITVQRRVDALTPQRSQGAGAGGEQAVDGPPQGMMTDVGSGPPGPGGLPPVAVGAIRRPGGNPPGGAGGAAGGAGGLPQGAMGALRRPGGSNTPGGGATG